MFASLACACITPVRLCRIYPEAHDLEMVGRFLGLYPEGRFMARGNGQWLFLNFVFVFVKTTFGVSAPGFKARNLLSLFGFLKLVVV